ncbi:hypothetical protein [Desulfosporosinus fructosivorans]
MSFILQILVVITGYILAYLLGRQFRYLIPKGKEFEIGSACGIGVMIIFMTKNFWLPSDKNDLYLAIGFGLASGLASSINFGRNRK